MNNKIKVKPMFASKKKLPKYKEGTPAVSDLYDPYTSKKLDTNEAKMISSIASPTKQLDIAGIGGIASGIGSMLAMDEAGSVANYAGDILGGAGQGASIGSALGPWGAGIGAVAGGVYGLFGAKSADRAQNRAETKAKINTNLIQNQDMSGNINAQYNLRNFTNTRVPGLAKGVAKFKSSSINPNIANAMIAPQEGVMDGNTGRISIVPGQYNESNPDTVAANLTDGSSVFSNKKSQILPGGKSTPADIIARTERMQKVNDKILSPKEGERKLSRLDKLTAELNQSNIQRQANNLNKFNMLINPQQQEVDNLPKYAGGSPKTKENPMPTDAPSVDPITGDVVYTQVPVNKGETMAKNAVPYLNQLAKNTWGGDYNFGRLNGSLDESLAGYYAGEINKQDSNYKVGSSTGYKPGKYNIPLTKSQADRYLISPNKSKIANNQSLDSNITNTKDVPDQINSIYNKNIQIEQNKSNPSIPVKTDLSSIGNKLMSLAPMAYNARNVEPEIATPIYQDYINPNQRYNISPELAESTKQRQISRYTNASINTGTGANMAYGADTYSRGVDQLSNLMGKAESANAGFRESYADRYNQAAGANAAENRRIYDLNARNRAAARTFGSKNAEMLSQYAQMNQLMKTQKNSDILNSNIWSAYASAVSPEQKAYLQSLMSKYTK